MKCVRCGEREAKDPCRCLVVERCIHDHWGKREISEYLSGTREAGLCPLCAARTALSSPPGMLGTAAIVLMIAAGIFFLLSVGKGDLPITKVTIPAAVICAVLFLLCWFVIGPVWAAVRPRDVVGSMYPRGKEPMACGDVELYIPVGENLYKNKKAFERAAGCFTGDFKEKLYREVIETGGWKALRHAPDNPSWVLPDLPDTPKSPAEEPVSIPDASDPEFTSACVKRLLQLYRQKPGGFPVSDAGEVRAVGKKLDEAGGMDLMLEAHRLFAAENPGMARNLEMCWDRIGGWAG